MFKDRAKISVKSGRGGNGHVSFRREKYVPNGGPDGGDGGTGGSIILEVDEGLNTLADFRHQRKFKAADGSDGDKKNKSGKSGADLILKVPEGTVIKEAESDKIIIDMSGENRRFTLLTGGRGGKGNQHYATSTMQAPKYAQPGQPSRELNILMELKVIADAGLIGFPNVGKSTFLTKVSNARPKVANYHFTTLNPYLGVVDLNEAKGFVVADIPGLIEGASTGVGLGFEFLRHIERTKVLIHVVDASGSEGRDPLDDIIKINNELSAYNPELMKRPQLIAANKIDMIYSGDENPVDRIKEAFEPKGIKVFAISALSGKGISELLYYVRHLLDGMEDEPTVFAPEFFPEEMLLSGNDPFTVSYDDKADEFVVEGPRIERMLGYTNLQAEKGFIFFQRFMKETGILDELEELGITDGKTVRVYELKFEYYK
ncbi:MAG: GTPase ObgE [Lachnospiraceae bacterium]|nr:GTPase ObgE [Lachnospiraceae bacterium]